MIDFIFFKINPSFELINGLKQLGLVTLAAYIFVFLMIFFLDKNTRELRAPMIRTFKRLGKSISHVLHISFALV